MPARYLLDCSYVCACLLEEKDAAWARSVLAEITRQECWVPGIWALELVSAIRSSERRKRISSSERSAALQLASTLKLHWDTQVHAITGMSDLVSQYGLTPYDSVYLELAQRRSLTLVSLDPALIKAARNAGLDVLTAHAP